MPIMVSKINFEITGINLTKQFFNKAISFDPTINTEILKEERRNKSILPLILSIQAIIKFFI